MITCFPIYSLLIIILLGDFAELHILFQTIREEPQELIEELNNLKFRNSRDDYYRARSLFNSTGDSVARSAILLYLNSHGYNGLYRVNSNNKFNVPFGKYSNPGMPSQENIMARSKILQSCTVMNSDFEAAVMDAVKGDFVYFDPPYMPLSKTSYFTGYTHSGFDEKDQERLAKSFRELSDKGVYVMESNSSTDFIKDLYKDFNLMEVDARRNINSVGTRRNSIKELIITNYGVI